MIKGTLKKLKIGFRTNFEMFLIFHPDDLVEIYATLTGMSPVDIGYPHIIRSGFSQLAPVNYVNTIGVCALRIDRNGIISGNSVHLHNDRTRGQ